MIATAYLRVYLPSVRVAGLPPHRGLNERRSLNLDDEFMWSEVTEDDAIYTQWEGQQFACPRNTRLRMLEGIVALSRTDWGSPLIASDDQHAAVIELASLRSESAISRSHILSSAWHVPLRWFAAFHPTEKELYDDSGITSIRYRTTIGTAIDRVGWAASVLENAGFAEQAIDHLNELEAWLAEFKPECMVELDYGRVATVFDPPDLVFDESALDVRESLLALEGGDFARSGEGYQRVVRRWATAQAYTFTN